MNATATNDKLVLLQRISTVLLQMLISAFALGSILLFDQKYQDAGVYWQSTNEYLERDAIALISESQFRIDLFIAITVCFICGLPIRINSKWNRSWKSKPSLPIGLTVLGYFFLILAYSAFSIMETYGDGAIRQEPNGFLALAGTFLIGFGFMHTYPSSFFPRRLEMKI